MVSVNRRRHGKHWLTSAEEEGSEDLDATIWRTVSLALWCWCHRCWCFGAFPGGSCSLQLIRPEQAPLQYRPTNTRSTHTGRVDKIRSGTHSVHDDTRNSGQTLDKHVANTVQDKSADTLQKHWRLRWQTTGAHVHSDAFRASNAHAFFFFFLFYNGFHHNQSQLWINREDILY